MFLRKPTIDSPIGPSPNGPSGGGGSISIEAIDAVESVATGPATTAITEAPIVATALLAEPIRIEAQTVVWRALDEDA